MKRRITAWLLMVMLVLGSLVSGCAEDAGQGGTASQGETEPSLVQSTEADVDAGLTALSVMETFNTAVPQMIEDNYRSYYEVFVYSFYDSDGDGTGDLKGLTEKLDYINDGDDSTDTDLGCNGIWLMPVMPSPTYHKYDVTDYCAIDPVYGTMEDFQAFLQECHDRGIRVILDLVMNHSSSQHPWFQSACEYLRSLTPGEEPDPNECPYVDYYHFSREKGSSSYAVAGTEWYYEAPFWSEMPDLNLGSEAVRAEFEQIVSFWLDLGVDGFRLDAVKEYYSNLTDANVEVLTWFNAMVKEKKPDAYLVAEVWTDLTTYARYYASGLDSCFNFAFADNSGIIANCVKGASEASAYGRAIMNLQDTISQYSDSYIDAPFYTNHDMGRGAGYYAGDYSENQTKLAQAMNLFMSGSSFLYYGEELGMKGAGKDENKRAPMYWSQDSGAEGMCNGPADMDTVKMKYGSLEEQESDGNSIYHFVKQALALRNAYPVIARGTAFFEETLSDDSLCVLRKTWEGENKTEEIVLVFNISETEQTLNLSGLSIGERAGDQIEVGGVLVTTAQTPEWDGTELTLPAYSVVILK